MNNVCESFKDARITCEISGLQYTYVYFLHSLRFLEAIDCFANPGRPPTCVAAPRMHNGYCLPSTYPPSTLIAFTSLHFYDTLTADF